MQYENSSTPCSDRKMPLEHIGPRSMIFQSIFRLEIFFLSKMPSIIRQTTKLCSRKCCQKKRKACTRLVARRCSKYPSDKFSLFSEKLQFSNFHLKDCKMLFVRVERCSTPKAFAQWSSTWKSWRILGWNRSTNGTTSSRVLWQRWVVFALAKDFSIYNLFLVIEQRGAWKAALSAII